MSTTKLRLDIPLVLPVATDARDHCVAALVASLQDRPGVERVHVRDGANGQGELCIHFDTDALSVEQIRTWTEQAGARLTDRFGHVSLRLDGIAHARAASRIADRLRVIPGVVRAEVSGAGFAVVEFDQEVLSESQVVAAFEHDGVSVAEVLARPSARPVEEVPAKAEPVRPKAEEHPHKHGVFGEQTELVFAILSGVCLLAGWLLSGRVPEPASLAFYVAAYGFAGFFTVREAIANLKRRRFEIDTLMLVAAAGAAALGAWAEGALLLFLFSLGHALEHFAMGRARRAIEALAKLAPESARVRRGDEIVEVPVAELVVGDVVVVRPDERLPADAVVVVGESSVNQAPVTGESVPVDKRPIADRAAASGDFSRIAAENRVFAGTINGAGALEVIVARPASETTLARVVRMVAEAEAQRSPTQRFTERIERVFVPSVLCLVGVLIFAFVVIDEPFSTSFYRAMAVLVAASPCALAISVPSAVLSGVARAGRGGVLVKGGGPLENLGTLKALALDKTGTLTEGKPRLTDVIPAPGVTREELLSTAIAVERMSDHPLAAAVARDGPGLLGEHAIPEARDVRSLTGRGVTGRVGDVEVHIGRPGLFENAQIEGPDLPQDVAEMARRLEQDGRTVMVARAGSRYLGVIGLMDTPREGARAMVARLRALGIKRIVMLSGDNQAVADSIAAQVDLNEAKGGLMPEDKVTFIQAMRRDEGKVAMVGDGVNDAPALAHATVGIAMGAAGSDVALETADVALMADDLEHLPFAVGLSRQTSRVIAQNLWVSLGVVGVLIPSTLLGLKIGAAILFHEGSTVLVVFNALRLLAFRDVRRANA